MQKNLTDSAYHDILAKYLMERYRSGHNGADSKSVRPQGLVGSNPTRSAKSKAAWLCCLWHFHAALFFYLKM
mgnify:CR=1 FL=1